MDLGSLMMAAMDASRSSVLKDRIGTAWRIGILALVGLGIYFPAWRGDWVWDDSLEVVNNAAIRGPVKALLQEWFAPTQIDYFPLKTTVQWIEWHLWGDNPLGYHLTSVGLHILAACLLWRVLRRLGVAKAWWGGLLFMVHPLAVESVAWIAELKNTLSLSLLLLAWDAHLSACEEGEAGSPRVFSRNGLKALGWFTAAMLAKSSVVMFPVCLLLHGWWRRGRITRGDLLGSAPFFAVSACLGAMTVLFQVTRAFEPGDYNNGTWGFRAAASGSHVLFYLGKFLWPVHLAPMYAHRPVAPLGADQLWSWPVLGLLAAGLGSGAPFMAGSPCSVWVGLSPTYCRCSASSRWPSSGMRGWPTISCMSRCWDLWRWRQPRRG